MGFVHVGTALFESSVFAMATHGRLVTCGNTSGDVATIPSLGFVFHHAISILGSGPYEPHEFGPAWERFCTGSFDPVVDSIEPLAEVAHAQERMQHNEVIGKILVRP
jgi:NADPH:quinone reductase-like Zn-dependent oxidoreductase